MSSSVKFAIIGCGRISSRHIDALGKTPNASLVALCDMNAERLAEREAPESVERYTNYHTMLQSRPDIDVVSVLTPSGMHVEHALDVVQTYKRNVAIEKPLAMTPAQGKKLGDEAARNGVQVFPIYQNRFNRAVQFAKDQLSGDGELGPVRVGTVRLRWCRPQRYYDLSPWRGTFSMDGGALTNQGIHYVDLLRYLCGDIKRVNSKMATLGADIEVEDTVVATIEFESGALGTLEVLTSARPDDFEASVSCVAEKGLIQIGGVATNTLEIFSPDNSVCAEHSEEFPTVYGFGHDVVMAGIADAVLGKGAPPTSLEDGLKTISLLHAIYRSDEVGDWVDLADNPTSERLGRPDDSLANLYRTPPEKN
ncbi:Gfo/Idh/MocA family protein [Nisaea sediminum]|uniref:Gfo/Idh/MocA family protein n=1 Tax=Nisaea sediminum TaxID=2775867 RepID=UPI001866465F|nr:Gfo/Idh/MocA family oxidoreductase [Nisaea sediminum]